MKQRGKKQKIMTFAGKYSTNVSRAAVTLDQITKHKMIMLLKFVWIALLGDEPLGGYLMEENKILPPVGSSV